MNKTIWLIYLSWIILIGRIIIPLTTLIHPVTIVIIILIYNIILCINIEFWKLNTIFPIIFFIIIIRGLLIIFLYFSSLISNEKNLNFIKNSIKLILIINLIYFLLYNYSYNFFNPFLIPLIQYNITNFTSNKLLIINLIYQYPFSNLTLISIIFLLITLISVIKTSTPKIKSLRKIN